MPATNANPPAPQELEALIRLLDDETPEVRERVSERLELCGGDLSEWLATRATALGGREMRLLDRALRPARRKALERDWIVPTGGAPALREDWELLEALLRAISDFLHDGVTLRQPLSDALDLLAEEAEEAGISDENELRAFLFESGRLEGNPSGGESDSDLAWVLAEGRSNPLGLCLIYLLTARRLGLEVEGVHFPGHFLCRIFIDGYPVIIDCFDRGRPHLQATLLEPGGDLNARQRSLIRRTADPGTILLRLLGNLERSLSDAGRTEDAALIHSLRETVR